ncbi:uncharacterized protein E5676_scaffold104G00110 [Cucumis melo var. makuwa]|uniref:RNase H type-1 domain-containing protein n=1 Tax=Cucumis melo var. makuwa TaxID=1194695 RepID=A0A5A7UFY4_CUCMM|nr:uncharacterized protein E6C27_scaffold24G005270 [Cucumis melo var. makuwa]TYJ95599.1 uncharacterized protein E5676_scaffold104G00110 [Cucumis melo var. makuwa]
MILDTIELDIDEIAQTNHVGVKMTSNVPPSTLLYDQRESLHGSSSSKGEPCKTIKGQVLANHPIRSDWKLYEDLLDDEVLFTKVMEPWFMYFDGATRRSGLGAGIILISPEKHMLPYIFALAKLCLNNVAEYQALIIDLQMTLEIRVSFIEIYGDSKLIINQLSLQYDVKHEDLKPYFAYAR